MPYVFFFEEILFNWSFWWAWM